MNSKRVSIIVPVYNKQIYLQDCINSLKRQTWQDIEVIMVDDGSSDESWEALKSLAKGDNRIRLFHIDHSGPSAARNAGIENASGDYITFVDADDYVESTYIEHLVLSIEDADLCLAGNKVWDQRKGRWEENPCCYGVFNNEEWYEQLDSMMNLIGGIGGKLYRRIFLKDHRIVFPEKIDRGEDDLFVTYVLLCLRKIVCIDHREYIVRKHDLGSLTHQKVTVEATEEVMEIYHRLEKRAKHPAMLAFLKHRQIECLGVIGRIYCYQDICMYSRKQLFFATARKYFLLKSRLFGFSGSKMEFVTRFSLLSQTFLPYYFLTKIWFWHKYDMRQLYINENKNNRTSIG